MCGDAVCRACLRAHRPAGAEYRDVNVGGRIRGKAVLVLQRVRNRRATATCNGVHINKNGAASHVRKPHPAIPQQRRARRRRDGVKRLDRRIVNVVRVKQFDVCNGHLESRRKVFKLRQAILDARQVDRPIPLEQCVNLAAQRKELTGKVTPDHADLLRQVVHITP